MGRGKPDRVGAARRKIKALRGTRRQQERRQAGKIRAVLACPDEGQRLCGEQGANKGTDGPGKTGPCWRGSAKDKGFVGNKAPTRAPGNRENPDNVGATRRKIKALLGTRRQQRRRENGRIRAVLAWLGEGQRLCWEQGANKGAGKQRKSGPCWRGPTKDKGFAGRSTPTSQKCIIKIL